MSKQNLINLVQSLAVEDNKYKTLLQQQQDTIQTTKQQLLPDLEERIRSHNQVLRNVYNKFDLAWVKVGEQTFYENHRIPQLFTPTKRYEKNRETYLVDTTQNIEVPEKFLYNNPIISAQHARKTVRTHQMLAATKQETTAQDQLEVLEEQKRHLEQKILTQQETKTHATKRIQNLTKHVETKLVKRIHNKQPVI